MAVAMAVACDGPISPARYCRAVRGLFVVNPRATTTSPRIIDVIVHALSDEIDLDVTVTTHRGHGVALGERAVAEGRDIVLTLGGDGIVHEVVNGLLATGPGPHVPMLATVPGGSGNVFARALGLPTDPVESTGLLLELVRAGVSRSIGLGRADDRWFVANAGLGIDAEIIAAMERKRRAGRTATPIRYLATTLEQFFRHTDRRSAPLTLDRAGERVDSVFFAFVQNTTPWTFFGDWPINPCPRAGFDTGLDLFGSRRLGVPTSLVAATRMVSGSPRVGTARGALVSWHDVDRFTVTADRPVAVQLDGEAMGERTELVFTAHADALRVVALQPLAQSPRISDGKSGQKPPS